MLATADPGYNVCTGPSCRALNLYPNFSLKKYDLVSRNLDYESVIMQARTSTGNLVKWICSYWFEWRLILIQENQYWSNSLTAV